MLGVEGVGAVDVGYGHDHQFELEVDVVSPPSSRQLLECTLASVFVIRRLAAALLTVAAVLTTYSFGNGLVGALDDKARVDSSIGLGGDPMVIMLIALVLGVACG